MNLWWTTDVSVDPVLRPFFYQLPALPATVALLERARQAPQAPALHVGENSISLATITRLWDRHTMGHAGFSYSREREIALHNMVEAVTRRMAMEVVAQDLEVPPWEYAVSCTDTAEVPCDVWQTERGARTLKSNLLARIAPAPGQNANSRQRRLLRELNARRHFCELRRTVAIVTPATEPECSPGELNRLLAPLDRRQRELQLDRCDAFATPQRLHRAQLWRATLEREDNCTNDGTALAHQRLGVELLPFPEVTERRR